MALPGGSAGVKNEPYESIFDVLVFFGTVIVSREYLVARLRISDKDSWADLGSPDFLERDYFLDKYPYKGWGRVFHSAE